MDTEFITTMQEIVISIKEAGYEPYDQLYAYVTTGNNSYITRKGNARALVAELDRDRIWNYIEPHIKQKGR